MIIKKKISVIGAGAWGTALANLLSKNGHETLIWALEEDCAASINDQHINNQYLPSIPLMPDLRATTSLSDCSGSSAILLVVPTQFMRETLKKLAPYVNDNLPIILCSKGIELGSLNLMTDVLKQEIPWATPAVLSGPSFAKDVGQGQPAAVTLAAKNHAVANELANIVSSEKFRPYTTQDIIGAEIGGAVKNVLAIACGVAIGMDLGRSAHAALISRGFAEMTRLGMALGADATTLTGLCGLGDLVLTCSSEQSRNMSFGMELGQGKKIDAILSSRNTVTEGVTTAPAIETLSQRLNIEMPICEIVAKIIREDINLEDAVLALLNRPTKAEQLDTYKLF
jgi:glycerol-3-phosphate dehydrogenase (NAD(P)+)